MKDQLSFEPLYPRHPWGIHWSDRYVASLDGVDYYKSSSSPIPGTLEMLSIRGTSPSEFPAEYCHRYDTATALNPIPDLIVAYVSLSK